MHGDDCIGIATNYIITRRGLDKGLDSNWLRTILAKQPIVWIRDIYQSLIIYGWVFEPSSSVRRPDSLVPVRRPGWENNAIDGKNNIDNKQESDINRQ